jgi:2-keto-3-deoxy-galactonokinase
MIIMVIGDWRFACFSDLLIGDWKLLSGDGRLSFVCVSGLLIGAEVASMRDFIAHEQAITIVAGASLTSRYEQAFRAVGRDVLTISGDTAFQAGIRSIAHAVAN